MWRDALRPSAPPQAVGELHAATGTAGDDDPGAGRVDLRRLPGADTGGELRMREEEGAGASAAHLRRGQLRELEARDPRDELPGLAVYALAPGEMARVMVGGAHAGRVGFGQVDGAREVLGGVERASRKTLRARLPPWVAGEQPRDLTLERRTAGGAGREHGLPAKGVQTGDDGARHRARAGLIAVHQERDSAAAVLGREDGFDACRAQDVDQRAADLGVHVRHHAARVEGDPAVEVRALLGSFTAAQRPGRQPRQDRALSPGQGRRMTPSPSSGLGANASFCTLAAVAARRSACAVA